MQAAYLAQQGITSQIQFFDSRDGFKDLYGDHQSNSLNGLKEIILGRAILDYPVIRKPWPSCAYTHRIIEAAEKIHDPSLQMEDIDEVIIEIPDPWT